MPRTPERAEQRQSAGPSNLAHARTKPRCRVKRVRWCLPGLHSVAQFLRSVPPETFLSTIVGKISETRAVKIQGTVLHINLIRLREKNELNLILLATGLRVVSEVRIHNHQVAYFLTARRLHVRITQAHWRAFGFVLPYIILGPWVESEGERRRAIKITFDEFLRPAIEAWRAGIPYAGIIFHLLESELEPIVEGIRLSHIHANLRGDEQGYSSESDREVDLENDELEFRQDDEILTFFGQPYIPAI